MDSKPIPSARKPSLYIVIKQEILAWGFRSHTCSHILPLLEPPSPSLVFAGDRAALVVSADLSIAANGGQRVRVVKVLSVGDDFGHTFAGFCCVAGEPVPEGRPNRQPRHRCWGGHARGAWPRGLPQDLTCIRGPCANRLTISTRSMGLPKKNPCPASHPMSRKVSSCACVSIPSATTRALNGTSISIKA